GGYASFPMLSAAILGAYPRIIMEQNAIPGLANRALGKWVDFAAVTDTRTQSYFGDRGVVTGNPVRPEFKSIPPKPHVAPYTVLIFGGSQGAQSINRAVMDALRGLFDWKNQLRFVHQTGERQLDEVKNAYAVKGFQADVRTFFNNFHEQYAAAVLELIGNPGQLKQIESNARRMAILDAEQRIVNLVERAVEKRRL